MNVIDLGSVPGVRVDVEAIKAAVAPMQALAGSVVDDGARAVSIWHQVESYYQAPEAPTLVAALDPVGPLIDRTGTRVLGLSAALSDYADRAEPLIAELRRLAAARSIAAPAQVARAALAAELVAAEQQCAAAIRALTAFDPRRQKIKVSEVVDKAAVAVTIGFVTLGENASSKEVTFSDGSVTLTAVDGAELGGAVSAGSVVDFGGGLTFEAGSTWRFATQGEADAFRGQILDYVMQQQAVMFDDTGSAAFGALVSGGVDPPRPPDLVSVEYAASVTADGSLDAGPTADVAGGVAVGLKQTVLTDSVTGATTTVLSREAAANGGAGATAGPVTLGGELSGLAGSSTAITRDASGQITKVVLTTTQQAGVSGNDRFGDQPDTGAHHESESATRSRTSCTTTPPSPR